MEASSRSSVGPSFGMKREAKLLDTPGPGSYDTANPENKRRPHSSKGAFNMTQRPDIWGEEKNKSNLGPAYDGVKSDFDKKTGKGPTIGTRRN